MAVLYALGLGALWVAFLASIVWVWSGVMFND